MAPVPPLPWVTMVPGASAAIRPKIAMLGAPAPPPPLPPPPPKPPKPPGPPQAVPRAAASIEEQHFRLRLGGWQAQEQAPHSLFLRSGLDAVRVHSRKAAARFRSGEGWREQPIGCTDLSGDGPKPIGMP